MTDLVYGTFVPTLADFGGAAAVRGDIFCNLLTEKVYIAGDGDVIEIGGGGGGGISIGDPVGGSDDDRVLFIGTGGVLAQDDNFRYAPSISVLFIGPPTGPGEYSQISRDGFYSASAAAANFISLDNTDGSATLSSLVGVGTRSIAADATGKIVVGGGTQTFSPTIIPFADGAGVLTESASLFWDGNYVNAPGIKMNAGGDNTLLRQNTNNLEFFSGATKIANLTPNNGSGGCVLSVTAQAYSAIGAEGAAPGDRNFIYALNPSTVAASSAGVWAAHNAGSGGVSSLDLFRYAASVVNNGWRVAAQQSTGDDLRFFITGAGGSSDLISALSRDAGFFLKNTVARPAALSNFGFAWADTEGSIALSGPNGDYFHWYQTLQNLFIGDNAGNAISGGTDNIALGKGAIGNGGSLTGSGNFAGGKNVLGKATGATGNVGIGTGNTMAELTTGDDNIALGESCMTDAVTGFCNIAAGYNCLPLLTSGSNNIALGESALAALITGSDHTSMGRESLTAAEGGSEVVAIGYRAMASAVNPIGHIAIGSTALSSSNGGVNGGSLTAVGYNCLWQCSSGDSNTGLGNNAGSNITTGSNNTFIGVSADGSATAGNQTSLGYQASCSGANQVTLGNSSIGALRCQVTSITALSDRRDKMNIRDSKYGMDLIRKVHSVEFDWNMRDGAVVGLPDLGFIADELAELDDETLRLVDHTNPDRLEATPGRLLAPMLRALQEVDARLLALERR